MERDRAIATFFFSSSSQSFPAEVLVFPVEFNLRVFTAEDTGGTLKAVDKFPSDDDSLDDADVFDDDDDVDDDDDRSGWDLHGDRQSTELEIGLKGPVGSTRRRGGPSSQSVE